MLASMLRAAGHRAVAAGNVGLPMLDAVLADPPYDVLAVELSSFQLHWTSTVALHAGALLNVAPDHLDWHGSMAAYAADKAQVWRGGAVPRRQRRRPAASSSWRGAGGRDRSAFTLGDPAPGQLGVARRAPCVDARRRARERRRRARRRRRRRTPAGPAQPGQRAGRRGAGPRLPRRPAAVPADAVRAGLRAFDPGPHRIAHVATVDGVAYVDDSKATNPHAAAASLQAFPHVVWVAGGLVKGAEFDELVAARPPTGCAARC